MTRRFVAPLLTLLCVVGVRAAAAQTVEEIVAKNILAKGGLDRIQAVQTLRQIGRISAQGMEAALTMQNKRPNFLRQDLRFQTGQMMTLAYDGSQAWEVTPNGSPGTLAGPAAEDARLQADFDGPLVNYQAKGITIEYVGTEPVDDKPAYHLRVTTPNHRVTNVYLDAATGLEMKIVSELGGRVSEQRISDYRTVDGLTMPFRVESVADGVRTALIVFEKIEVNVSIGDDVFRMPKGAERR